MSKFELWIVYQDGRVEAQPLWQEREAFVGDIERYLAAKQGEGRALTPADTVLALFAQTVVAARNKFGLIKRALRHFDEIGICSDVVDAIEQAADEGAIRIGWGNWTAEGLQAAEPHDFGDCQV